MAKILIQKDSNYEYKFHNDSRQAKRRVKTLFVKEEGTAKWISEFTANDVFYDIGANIGIYTILAAPRTHSVYAFEPHLGNAHSLLRNVELNKYQNVVLYTCALHDRQGFMNFNYANTDIGASQSQFSSNASGVSERKYGISLDRLVSMEHVAGPTRLKLDVDGNEEFVLMGMKETLRAGTIESMIIERDYKAERNPEFIDEYLGDHGYVRVEVQLTAIGKRRRKMGITLDKIAHNVLYRRAKK